MINHVIMFKWRPGTSDAQISAAAQALLGLKSTITAIVDARFGPAVSGSEFDHGMLIVLPDVASLAAYVAHPSHINAVKEHLNPIRERIQAFDFES
jgi:phage tail protein X